MDRGVSGVNLAGKQGKKGEEKQRSAFIIMCNKETIQRGVLGLPAMKHDDVKKIDLGTKLFLYDLDAKLLHGIYKVGSKEENGDASGGKFPSQVKFEVLENCFPLTESELTTAIPEICEVGSKFIWELSNKQVEILDPLFQRPFSIPFPATYWVGDKPSIVPLSVDPIDYSIHRFY